MTDFNPQCSTKTPNVQPTVAATLESTVDSLPFNVRRFLASCPRAGAGVHGWIFRASLTLKNHCDAETAFNVIRLSASNCGRDIPTREIKDAIQNAWNTDDGRSRGRRWPTQDQRRITAVISRGPTVAESIERSPERVEPNRTDWLIDQLFPGENALLCVGSRMNQAVTRRKEVLRGAFINYQFIVPTRMVACRGRTKGGKTTQRSLENTAEREFLVVETDPPKWADIPAEEKSRFRTEAEYSAQKKDEAAAILWELSRLTSAIPLTVIVDSGAKSLHGWFNVSRITEETAARFFAHAVALGADPATWTRCQFVRMPNGTRENGKRQSVLYFSSVALTKEAK